MTIRSFFFCKKGNTSVILELNVKVSNFVVAMHVETSHANLRQLSEAV